MLSDFLQYVQLIFATPLPSISHPRILCTFPEGCNCMRPCYIHDSMEILKNPSLAKPLFMGKNSPFFDACLYSGMGSVYADRSKKPKSAIALIGDFAMLGGQPSEALLKRFLTFRSEAYLILVGPDQPVEQAMNCLQQPSKSLHALRPKKNDTVWNTLKKGYR